MKFARVQVESVDEEKRAGEFAMGAHPCVHPRSGVFGTATHRYVRVKRAQFHFESERKERIIDALSELMQPRMTGPDADPEHARWTFLRECPHAFDGQDERFDADGREPFFQRIAGLWRDIAEESESDVKLFNGCPAHATQRCPERSDGDPHRLGRRERDEQPLRSVCRRGHERTLPNPASAQSRPIKIKADADAFFVDAIGGDFVAQPALEQNHVSGFGRVSDMGTVGRTGGG